jgi:tetratricopeptide (TPR) repeat protein
MKRSERHRLKENELALLAGRTGSVLTRRRREIGGAVVAAILLVVLVTGFMWWRGRAENHASALLADALTVLDAPVTPPPPPSPDQATPPAPQAGSYATERAKLDAALPKLTAVYTQYPTTRSAVTARYHAANALAALGRSGEAEKLYQEVADGDGIYASMARLGLANQLAAAGQHDRAIAIYKELSAQPASNVPVDGVLMQLGRTYERAGRSSEAQQTFSRLVQEFPDSLYAAEARRQMEALKKS